MARRVVDTYKDSAGKYRWRAEDPVTHNITADSGQGYTRKASAKRAAEREYGESHEVTFRDVVI